MRDKKNKKNPEATGELTPDELLEQLLETLNEEMPPKNEESETRLPLEEEAPLFSDTLAEDDAAFLSALGAESHMEAVSAPSEPLEVSEYSDSADALIIEDSEAYTELNAKEEEATAEDIKEETVSDPNLLFGFVPAGKYGAVYLFRTRKKVKTEAFSGEENTPMTLNESIRSAEEYARHLEDRISHSAEFPAVSAEDAIPEEDIPAEEEILPETLPEIGEDTESEPEEIEGELAAPAEEEKPFEIPEAYDEAEASADERQPSGTTDEFSEISDLAKEAVSAVNGENTESEEAPPTPSPLSGLDEVDVNLMEIFGMEKELHEKLGTEEFDRLRKQSEESEDLSDSDHPVEYENFEQNKEFLHRFKNKFRKTSLRLLLALVLTVIALVSELFRDNFLSGKGNPEYLVIYMLGMLQLTLLIAAVSLKEVFTGIKAVFKGKAKPELILSLMALSNIGYELTLLLTRALDGNRTYNLPLAICALSAIVYTRLSEKRELMSFKVISTRKPKYVISHMPGGESDLEKAAFSEFLDDNSEIFSVHKTEFVEGFSRRSVQVGGGKSVVGILVPAALIAGIVFFVLGYYRSGAASFADCFAAASSAGQLCLMFVLPCCSFAAYALPFYKAAKESYQSGSAIIGDGALEEYADASVISFNDEDVFPAGRARIRSMRLFGQNRIDVVLYKTASVFHKIGGPLSAVFSSATKDLGHSEDTEIIEVAKSGVDAAVDGIPVLAGSASYMRKNGFNPPIAEGDEELEYQSQISIMYIAIGGELAAKVYVEYRMDPDFEGIIKALYRSGMCIGIRTLDPNIDDAMLDRRIKLSKYPVRILKCEQKENLSATAPRLNSGVVSKRSVKSLLKTLTYCDRIQQVTKINVAVKIFSMIAGIALAALLFVFGGNSAASSLYVTLYQLFWMIPIILLSWLLV